MWALTRSFAHLCPNLIINECSMCVVRLGSMSVHLHTDGEFILTFQTGVHEKHALRLTLVFFPSPSSPLPLHVFSLVFSHVLLLFHLWRVKLEWVLSFNQIVKGFIYLFACLFVYFYTFPDYTWCHQPPDTIRLSISAFIWIAKLLLATGSFYGMPKSLF